MTELWKTPPPTPQLSLLSPGSLPTFISTRKPPRAAPAVKDTQTAELSSPVLPTQVTA